MSVRFDNPAQMPMNLQQKVMPVIDDIRRRQVAAVMREQEKEASKLVVMGIPFATEQAAARCWDLLHAERNSVIFDLRIHYKVSLEGSYIKPNGDKVPEKYLVADFTYKTDPADDAQVTMEIMANRRIAPMDIHRLHQMGYIIRRI